MGGQSQGVCLAFLIHFQFIYIVVISNKMIVAMGGQILISPKFSIVPHNQRKITNSTATTSTEQKTNYEGI